MRFTKDESADGNRRVWNALVSAAHLLIFSAVLTTSFLY